MNEHVKLAGSSPGDSLQDELQRLYDQAFALSDSDARAAKVMADEVYTKAGDAKNPHWQSLSRYLAGFCFYNLGEYDSAMEEFERGDHIAQEHNLPTSRDQVPEWIWGALLAAWDGTRTP